MRDRMDRAKALERHRRQKLAYAKWRLKYETDVEFRWHVDELRLKYYNSRGRVMNRNHNNNERWIKSLHGAVDSILLNGADLGLVPGDGGYDFLLPPATAAADDPEKDINGDMEEESS
jgi:hypothetical protein